MEPRRSSPSYARTRSLLPFSSRCWSWWSAFRSGLLRARPLCAVRSRGAVGTQRPCYPGAEGRQLAGRCRDSTRAAASAAAAAVAAAAVVLVVFIHPRTSTASLTGRWREKEAVAAPWQMVCLEYGHRTSFRVGLGDKRPEEAALWTYSRALRPTARLALLPAAPSRNSSPSLHSQNPGLLRARGTHSGYRTYTSRSSPGCSYFWVSRPQ